MRTRDWAGTVLVACLVAAAGLLRDHTVLLLGFAVVAVACALVIAWDVSGERAIAKYRDPVHERAGIRAGHAVIAGGDVQAAASIEAGWGISAGGDVRAGTQPQDSESLTAVLLTAVSDGRRLSAEAIELEPIGHLPHVDDLVRRYNAWEARVSDALVRDGKLPGEWRTAWLSDPDWANPHVNPTRHDLDRLAQTIGYRLRLIDQMLRALRQGRGATA